MAARGRVSQHGSVDPSGRGRTPNGEVGCHRSESVPPLLTDTHFCSHVLDDCMQRSGGCQHQALFSAASFLPFGTSYSKAWSHWSMAMVTLVEEGTIGAIGAQEMRDHMKIGVIGAGAVGSACLLSSILRGIAREIVVVDRDRKRARAVVTDLQVRCSAVTGRPDSRRRVLGPHRRGTRHDHCRHE